MSLYLVQVGYNQSGWQAQISEPQDRMQKIRPAVEQLGGSVVGGWISFGEYDLVAILELPDNASAAAFSIAASAGGAVTEIKTTPLLSTEEGLDALRKAGESSYRPPGS